MNTARVVWAWRGGGLSLLTGVGLSPLCCQFGDLRWNRMVVRLLLWCTVLRLKESVLQNSLQLTEDSVFKKYESCLISKGLETASHYKQAK